MQAHSDAPERESTGTPRFDPSADGFFDDPYTQYAELRTSAPVQRTRGGVTVCFGYDDVRRVLVDSRTSMDAARVAALVPGRDRGAASQLFPHGVINLDAPGHTRLRRLMSKSFSPRTIQTLSEWITVEVDRLLDELGKAWNGHGEPVDVIDGYAFPLPFTVISDLLGMPKSDEDQVRRWAQDVSAATDPTARRAQVTAAHDAYAAISEYVSSEVLPWKRAHPQDDLLSNLQAAQDAGKLSEAELLDQVTLLYVAGHETTVGLIGNSLLTLLRHRRELERLRSTPDLLPNAIEELNRYESAIQFGWRYTLEELPIGDHIVEPGQMVLLGIGSANRDQDHFGPDAGELDLSRPNASDAVAFGAGTHFCIGNALARREAAIAVGRFLDRFPSASLAGEPAWNNRITFRALTRLDVALDS